MLATHSLRHTLYYCENFMWVPLPYEWVPPNMESDEDNLVRLT